MRLKGVLVVILASVFYSLAMILNKMAFTIGVDPYQYALFTMSILAIISFGFLAWKRKVVAQVTKKEFLLMAVIGIFASGVCHLLFMSGQSLTTAVNAGFLSMMSVPFAALFSIFILGERLSSRKWLYAALAFIGMSVLTTNLRLTGLNTGDLLLLLAMVFAGLTNVLAKIATKRLSGPFVSSFRMVFGWAVIMLFVRTFSWQGVSKVWWLVILSSLLAYGFMVCLFWGIKLTTPTTAGVIYLSEVIFTSILAIVILGETLSLVQWLGGLLGGAAIVGFALCK